MKKPIVYIFLLLQTLVFAQSKTEIKNLLISNFPEKDTITENSWVYFKDNNDLEELNIPLIKSKLDKFEFYRVSLTNFIGYHVTDCKCIILYSKKEKNIIMQPPIWFYGMDYKFYKNLIGIKLIDKTELRIFASEFKKIIMNDSNQKIKETIFEDNSITYKITLSDRENLHDILQVILKDNSIFEIRKLDVKNLKIIESIK